MKRENIIKFVTESNRIEGITRAPTPAELSATGEFLAIRELTVLDFRYLADVYAGADLRDRPGMNVRVGSHIPPRGGPQIVKALEEIIDLTRYPYAEHPYIVHQKYETLHPFMDGNGRTGRALWAWMMYGEGIPWQDIGFLHAWYYQSLQFGSER